MKTFFCFVLLHCTISFFGQENYSLLSVSKEMMANANSILLDELVEIDVTNIAKMKTKKRRVVMVLNKQGDNDIKPYEYYSQNSKVKKIEAKVFDATGKEINRFKKRDFMDVSRTGNNMYVDSRLIYLKYTPTVYPYIMVFESETESGDTAFIDAWVPLGGYAESTQKSVYRIKFDPANKPRYRARNLEGFDISIEESPDQMVFTASNLKALRYEEHSPLMSRIFPTVMLALDSFYLKGTLGRAKDWKEFGQWMEKDLLSDVRDIPSGTVARVKNLVANETTNEGKARKVYQFVQDKVRYVSIQIGIGGWKPMPASEVDKLSYGDCKALTNYTKTLLDAVGVPSYYTILYGDKSKWNIMDDFASVHGNHMILGIPDGDDITWLECTSQDAPYGYIGSFTDDRDVLIITDEGGKIAHTKVYTTAESTQENTATVKVNSKGAVVANLTGISKGIQYEDKYLLPKKKVEDIDRYYKNRWKYINGLSGLEWNFKNDKTNIAFTETVSLSIPNYANAVGNDFLFCPNIFNQHTYIPPRITDRNQNLYIGQGFLDIDIVNVEVPENFKVDDLPEPTLLETQFGKYKTEIVKTSDNKFTYTRTFQIEKGEYPPQEYENYRDFLRTIARLDKSMILLKQILN